MLKALDGDGREAEEQTRLFSRRGGRLGELEPDEMQAMARAVAGKSAGVSVGELLGIVQEGVRLARRRWMEEEQQRRDEMQRRTRLSASPASSLSSSLPSLPVILQPFCLTLPDLLSSLSTFTSRSSALSGALSSIPNTRWADIGGLEHVKREIDDIISLPLRHPGLFSSSSSSASGSARRRGGILLFGPPGTGKCFAAGTRLRLHDGSAVAVEDIRGGELLMGDDSSPRRVCPCSLTHSRALLYRISPLWEGAEAFTVNGDHILVLHVTAPPGKRRQSKAPHASWSVSWYELSSRHQLQRVTRVFASEAEADAELQQARQSSGSLEWEVSVDDFLASPEHVQRCCRLMQSGPVNFYSPLQLRLSSALRAVLHAAASKEQLAWAAWYLGLWSSSGVRGSPDCLLPAAVAGRLGSRLSQYEKLFGEPVQQLSPQSSRAGHRAVLFSLGRPAKSSVAQYILQAYDQLQCEQRRLPQPWICDSLDVRRCILAGIIDGCHEQSAGVCHLTAELQEMAMDCKLLAGSLGIRSSAVSGVKCSTADGRVCYRVTLSGQTAEVVAHCASSAWFLQEAGGGGLSSQAAGRSFGFTVEAQAVSDYYGFAVSGANRRFLLADFTVTHNVSSPAPLALTASRITCTHCSVSVFTVSVRCVDSGGEGCGG